MKYSPIDYAKVLIMIEQESDSQNQAELVSKFKQVLEKNNDLSLIKEIEDAYLNLQTKTQGKTAITVEYFGHIDKTKIQQKFNDKAKISFVEKPKLQGGLRININDLRIDNSLKQRLENLKEIIA